MDEVFIWRLEVIALYQKDVVLGNDEEFLIIVAYFDGAALKEKGKVAGLDLQRQVTGAVVGRFPGIAIVHGGQRIARAAFEDIARLHFFFVLVACREIETAACAVDGVGGLD